ncbi:MAG: hypothetical protein U5K69_25575 [Balneolaceae bacterium]|nr:hypothetical protein [Balneolaceae bacterium]
MADYFEEVLEEVGDPKAVSNVVLTEVLRVLNERSIGIRDFTISTERLAGLIQIRENDKISSSAMTEIFNEMLTQDKDAEQLAEEMNLLQVSDDSFLEPIVDAVIDEHPDEVERYKDGKKGLIGFFIGQVMQRSQGKANPQLVREMITDKLED